jgi:hypothetical protein
VFSTASLGVNPAPLPGFVLERLSTISGEINQKLSARRSAAAQAHTALFRRCPLAPENLLLAKVPTTYCAI